MDEEFRMKLFKHQTAAIAMAREGNLALFHDCGTCKTVTSLNIIQYFKERLISPALVVCPLTIIEDAWIEDNRKFTPNLDIVSLWDKNSKNVFHLSGIKA